MDFLGEVSRRLDVPPGEKEQVLKELASHFRELRDELVKGGMSEAEAETEAAGKMGTPQEIASRLQKVHMRSSWKGVLLTALPVAGMILLSVFWHVFPDYFSSKPWPYPFASFWVLMMMIFCAGFTVIMTAGVVRELAADRRPVWLTTWLPAAIMGVLILFVDIILPWTGFEHRMLSPGEHPHLIVMIPQIFVIWLLAMWAFRRSWGWVVLLTALSVLKVYFIYSFLGSSFDIVLNLVSRFIIIAVYVMLFGLHRFGSIHKVSLALFTGIFFSTFLSISSPTILGRFEFNPTEIVVLYVLMALLSVVLVTRASTLLWKMSIIAISIVAIEICCILPNYISPGLYQTFSIPSTFPIYWIERALDMLVWTVVVPLLVLYRRTVRMRNMPPVVNA